MMKEFFISMMIIAMILLAGCTSDTSDEEEDGAPEGKTDREVFIGSWERIFVYDEPIGTTTDGNKLICNSDGTGKEGIETKDMTWTVDENTKTISWTGNSTGSYKYTIKSNDKIVIDIAEENGANEAYLKRTA